MYLHHAQRQYLSSTGLCTLLFLTLAPQPARHSPAFPGRFRRAFPPVSGRFLTFPGVSGGLSVKSVHAPNIRNYRITLAKQTFRGCRASRAAAFPPLELGLIIILKKGTEVARGAPRPGPVAAWPLLEFYSAVVLLARCCMAGGGAARAGRTAGPGGRRTGLAAQEPGGLGQGAGLA